MIHITADPHFNHENIIRYCNRPFGSLQEMNSTMISNWNAVVHKDDETWIVGDMMMKVDLGIIWELNGTIMLVPGSHDAKLIKEIAKHHELWDKIKVTAPLVDVSLSGHSIIMCHYAMRVWHKSHFNSYHVYGHSHGRLPGVGKSFDVGVDCTGFTPLTINQVLTRMESLPDNPNLVKDRYEREAREARMREEERN